MEQQFGKKPLLTKQEPICLSGDVVSLFVPKNIPGWKVSTEGTTKVRDHVFLSCDMSKYTWYMHGVQYTVAAYKSDGSPY